MWQNKFDNSKIRDYNRDNREETRIFCPYVLISYVLTTANGASGGATKPHP